MLICFLLAFVMSAAMAFPQDEVIPETSPTLSQLSVGHPELKHATPKDAAHAKIKMMQAQGFDNTQCKQLATDAITGMTSTLKAEQDTMTALSTGADCLVVTPATRRLLGIAAQQQLLDDAAAALVLAKADLATKETALATASSAPVSITMTLDTIGTNMAAIGQAVSLDSAVVSAKAAVVTAQAVKDAATLVVVADQASFDTASTAAQDASQECLCNAKAAHDTAWPNAQKVVTDNTQAWKEAHHVKCALDGTADDACSVPAFTVTNKVLVTEAANVVCTEAPTSAPTPAPRTCNRQNQGGFTDTPGWTVDGNSVTTCGWMAHHLLCTAMANCECYEQGGDKKCQWAYLQAGHGLPAANCGICRGFKIPDTGAGWAHHNSDASTQVWTGNWICPAGTGNCGWPSSS